MYSSSPAAGLSMPIANGRVKSAENRVALIGIFSTELNFGVCTSLELQKNLKNSTSPVEDKISSSLLSFSFTLLTYL